MGISSPNVVQGKENPLVASLKYANDAIKQSFQLMQNAKELGLREKDMNYQKNLEVLKQITATYEGYEEQFGPAEAWNRTRSLFGATYAALGMEPEVFADMDRNIVGGAWTPQDYQTAAFNAYMNEPRGTLEGTTPAEINAGAQEAAEQRATVHKARTATVTGAIEDPSQRTYSSAEAYREPARVVNEAAGSPYMTALAQVQELYKKKFKSDEKGGDSAYVNSVLHYREEYRKEVSDLLFDSEIGQKLTNDERVAILTESGNQVVRAGGEGWLGAAVEATKGAFNPNYKLPAEAQTAWYKGDFSPPVQRKPEVAPDPKVEKEKGFWAELQGKENIGKWKGISYEDAKKQGLIEKAKEGNKGTWAKWDAQKGLGLKEALVTPGPLVESSVTITGPAKPFTNDAERSAWQTDYAKSLVGKNDAQGRPISEAYAKNLASIAVEMNPKTTIETIAPNKPVIAKSEPPRNWEISGAKQNFVPQGIPPDSMSNETTWNFGRSVYERWAKAQAGVEFGKGDQIRYTNSMRQYFSDTPGMREVKNTELNNYLMFLGNGDGALGKERLNIAMHKDVYALQTQRMGEERLAEEVFTVDPALQEAIGVKVGDKLTADQLGAFTSIFGTVMAVSGSGSGGMSDAEWKEYEDHAKRADDINAELWKAAGGNNDKYITLQNERMLADNNYSVAVNFLQIYWQSRYGVTTDAQGNLVQAGDTKSRYTTGGGFLGIGKLLNPKRYGLNALPTFQFRGSTPATPAANGTPARSEAANKYLEDSGYKRVTD